MVRPAKASGPTPTGTVSLVSRNGQVFDGPVALTNGNATLIVSFAAANQFEVALNYSGDTNYSPFTSSVLTTQVNRGTPTVTLKAASGIVPPHTQTSLTVNVVGAPNDPIISQNPAARPSGTVQFFDSVDGGGARPLGPAEFLTTGNGGNPIFTLPTVLPLGNNVITVKYSGDVNWLSEISNEVTVTVK
jgi:Bacterial Ig-like domain (group 3)